MSSNDETVKVHLDENGKGELPTQIIRTDRTARYLGELPDTIEKLEAGIRDRLEAELRQQFVAEYQQQVDLEKKSLREEADDEKKRLREEADDEKKRLCGEADDEKKRLREEADDEKKRLETENKRLRQEADNGRENARLQLLLAETNKSSRVILEKLNDYVKDQSVHQPGPFISEFMLCNTTIPFVDRDESINFMADFFTSRIQDPLSPDDKLTKSNCKIQCLFTGPGGGKSRQLTEYPHRLSKCLNDRNVNLNQRPFFVNITFNTNSPLYSDELFIEFALTRRIIHSILYSVPPEVKGFTDISSIHYLNFDLTKIVGIIRSHGYTALFIGVDEINKLIPDPGTTSDDVKRSRLYSLINWLCPESFRLSDEKFNVFPIFAGTTVGKGLETAGLSGYSAVNIPLPLLQVDTSLDAVLTVIKPQHLKHFGESHFSNGLINCLRELGGHCRSVQFLIEALMQRSYDNLTKTEQVTFWIECMEIVTGRVRSEYLTSVDLASLDRAIAAAVLSVRVRRNDKAASNGCTFGDLEDRGLIKLFEPPINIPENGLSVLVPFVFVSIRCSDPASAFHRFYNRTPSNVVTWQFWETFNRDFLGFRIICFKIFNPKLKFIKLNTLLPGVWSKAIANENLEIRIPQELRKGELDSPYTHDTKFIVNTIYSAKSGDIFDGIACFNLRDSTKILIPLQMKHTNGKRTLSVEQLKKEWVKVNSPLSPEHRSMFHFLLVCANFDSNIENINKIKIVYTEPEQYFSKYFKRIFAAGNRPPSPVNTRAPMVRAVDTEGTAKSPPPQKFSNPL